MNNYTKKVPLQNVHLLFSLFFNMVEKFKDFLVLVSYFFISTSIKSYKLPIRAYLLLESCQVTSGKIWKLNSLLTNIYVYQSVFISALHHWVKGG